jgi:hypothetical protein
MERMRFLLVMMLALALTSGCAAPVQVYPGEKLPRDQVARIERSTFCNYHDFPASAVISLYVDTVNGEAAPKGSVLEVLPGQQTLGVDVSILTRALSAPSLYSKPPFRLSPSTLTFRAEAGHEYKIKTQVLLEPTQNRIAWWAEDAESGSVVAGEKPPPEPPMEPGAGPTR